MDIIWRWATSIAVFTLVLQFIAGCGTMTVLEAVFVAVIITLLNAGLKSIWPLLKIPYFQTLLFLAVLLIINVITIVTLATLTSLVYIVDQNSALFVIGCITIVGGFVQMVPVLSEDISLPRKKKVLR